MDQFILTEEMKEEIRQQDEWLKRFLGRYDLESMFSDDGEKFYRRKFGKLSCPYCKHKFNPYYAKTLVQGEWDWVWQGCSHKEPESKCEVDCPKCKEKLHFTQCIGQ